MILITSGILLLIALATLVATSIILARQIRQAMTLEPAANETHAADSPALILLTRRERQVLRLIADGHSAQQVAGNLGVDLEDIRDYVAAIQKKL